MRSAHFGGRTRAVLAMMTATIFIAITYEMLPVGLLSTIADDVRTDVRGAGHLVSVYAFVVLCSAIPLAALTARWQPVPVLTVVLGVFAVSSVVLASSTSLTAALAARLVGGLAHAVLFTTTFRIAVASAPPPLRGRAIAVLSFGNATALSLGVPAAAALGGSTRWQAPVWVLAGLFALMAVAVLRLVPRHRGPAAAGAQTSVLAAVASPPLLRVGATVALLITAHFTTYTYVEPLLRQAGVGDGGVSVVLFAYGVAGVAGLLVARRRADTTPRRTALCGLALLVVLLTTLTVGAGQLVAVLVCVVLWGATMGSLPVLMQMLALRSSPSASAAPAVVNTSFNLGIMLGPLLGGVVASHGSLTTASSVSAVLLVVVLGLGLLPRWLPRDHPAEPTRTDRTA